jgi:hypothetical protein
MAQYDVYLELGSKRTFASALDWPGWCRQGRSEDEALDALLEYGPRYGAIIGRTRLGFRAPTKREQLAVVERLRGTATTDFGAPGVAPTADRERTCSAAELQRFETILKAGWRAFDRTLEAAKGRTLSTGPRGGGRTLAGIASHVLEADQGYLSAAGWRGPKPPSDARGKLLATREAILETMRASARGDIPARGPRGGTRWTARYFVRRVAWHLMAHIWEIERRSA